MTHEKKITSKLINTARNQWTLCLLFIHTQLKFTYSKNVMLIPGKRKGVTLSSCLITTVKSTSVQKSNKNEIFMARVKYSNCFNFCTQVDPSKTRKAAYFFSSNMFLFSRKTNFSLPTSRIDGSGHNRSKIEHFRSLRISKILRLGKSYQRVLFHRLFVFCKM